jgi:hypothetical protein
VINRKFLRSKVVPIAEETRKIIQEKIGSKDSGQDIFDTAQLEVEDRMTRTTYRNFLASEAYLNYVQMMQTGETLLTKTAKKRGVTKNVLSYFFCSHKFHKIEYYFF